MGKVEHLGNAVDHGIAQGDDGVDAAQADAGEYVAQEGHVHTSLSGIGRRGPPNSGGPLPHAHRRPII